MTELTAKGKTSVVTCVIIFVGVMFGFHYETVVHGLFPDYSVEPYSTELYNEEHQCKTAPLKDYVGTFHELR